MRVDRNAKSDHKGLFQIYKTKNKDRIGPLKKDDAMIVENTIETNDDFLSVFTHANLTT